ncbi:HNH endonuclease [Roseateles microcysteis]|uniref:HNH endonuclease n=1 Tax=Roseateles microcysteis TaxID=3119057 RepID=UPI002FE68FE9
MKQLERLLFLQGQRCFFCQQSIPDGEASVEHLVASANGGTNGDDNCVACCKAVNSALGSLSIKEKLRVVLNQRGPFSCPKSRNSNQIDGAALVGPDEERIFAVLADLQKRGSARPRKVGTLQNTISAVFHKKLTEQEVEYLFEALVAKGYVVVDDQKVSYALPQRAG